MSLNLDGMSPRDRLIWEAAQRCAASAPEIRPGDEVAIRLQQSYRNFPAFLREYRAAKQQDAA